MSKVWLVVEANGQKSWENIGSWFVTAITVCVFVHIITGKKERKGNVFHIQFHSIRIPFDSVF